MRARTSRSRRLTASAGSGCFEDADCGLLTRCVGAVGSPDDPEIDPDNPPRPGTCELAPMQLGAVVGTALVVYYAYQTLRGL